MEEPAGYPLVIALMKRSRLPWYWLIIIMAVVYLGLLVLATYLDGASSSLGSWNLWRNFLDGPSLALYLLLVYPFV